MHACVSVIAVPLPHVPPEHVGVMHVRVCVPVRSQLIAVVCVQVPHAPHMTAPQLVPSLLAIVHEAMLVIMFG
jgi:hypothetical protein